MRRAWPNRNWGRRGSSRAALPQNAGTGGSQVQWCWGAVTDDQQSKRAAPAAQQQKLESTFNHLKGEQLLLAFACGSRAASGWP